MSDAATVPTKTRQRGRPTKPAKGGEKTTLSLRVTPEMKRRLDNAASSSGRNLSQEAEFRLERSFFGGDLLDAIIKLLLVMADDWRRQCEAVGLDEQAHRYVDLMANVRAEQREAATREPDPQKAVSSPDRG